MNSPHTRRGMLAWLLGIAGGSRFSPVSAQNPVPGPHPTPSPAPTPSPDSVYAMMQRQTGPQVIADYMNETLSTISQSLSQNVSAGPTISINQGPFVPYIAPVPEWERPEPDFTEEDDPRRYLNDPTLDDSIFQQEISD